MSEIFWGSIERWGEVVEANSFSSNLDSYLSKEEYQTILDMGYDALPLIRDLADDILHNRHEMGHGMIGYFIPSMVAEIVGEEDFLKPGQETGVQEQGGFIQYSLDDMLSNTINWLDENMTKYVEV